MLEILKNEDIKILRQGSLDLMVESYSNATRTLQIRGMSQEQAISADITTSSDRSLITSIIDITNVPITLTARTTARGVKKGELYIKVSLRVDGVVVALLMAGYVAETHKIAYPGGFFEGSIDENGLMRTILGTDPAAGVEILETVPAGARWKLKAFNCALSTDATVANRYPRIQITDGTNIIWEEDPPTAQTASLTQNFNTGPSTIRTAVAIANKIWALPSEMTLEAGYQIKTATISLQAGDNWGVPKITVEEYINP